MTDLHESFRREVARSLELERTLDGVLLYLAAILRSGAVTLTQEDLEKAAGLAIRTQRQEDGSVVLSVETPADAEQ